MSNFSKDVLEKFAAEDLSALLDAGISASVVYEKQPYFYNHDLMEYEPLSALKADYREALDNDPETLEDDEIFCFADFVDYVTAMGGSCVEINTFYCPTENGILMPEKGDESFEFAFQAACDYASFEEEEGRFPVMGIARVFCPDYER